MSASGIVHCRTKAFGADGKAAFMRDAPIESPAAAARAANGAIALLKRACGFSSALRASSEHVQPASGAGSGEAWYVRAALLAEKARSASEHKARMDQAREVMALLADLHAETLFLDGERGRLLVEATFQETTAGVGLERLKGHGALRERTRDGFGRGWEVPLPAPYMRTASLMAAVARSTFAASPDASERCLLGAADVPGQGSATLDAVVRAGVPQRRAELIGKLRAALSPFDAQELADEIEGTFK